MNLGNKACKSSKQMIKTVGRKVARKQEGMCANYAEENAKQPRMYANKQGRNYSKNKRQKQQRTMHKLRKEKQQGARKESLQLKYRIARQKVSKESCEELGQKY